MALDFQYGSGISKAIRDLLLCRVKLVGAASIGAEEVTIAGAEDRDYPGNRFFLNYTTAATLVQPTSADTPTGITHQENVTIDAASTYTDNLVGTTIALTGAITKAYNTSAYIRPATLPAACSGLKFIDNDFIPSLNFAPKDEWFPGAIVTRMGMVQEMTTAAGVITFRYHFRVYYCDILQEDRNNADTLWDAAEVLRDLIMEDNYLAGTVLESEVMDLLPWYSTEITQRGFNFVTATHLLPVGWMQFDIMAERKGAWAKHGVV